MAVAKKKLSVAEEGQWRPPSSSPVLVGRDPELAALVDAVEASPTIAMIEGEAGLGKTRLVRELLAHPAVRGRAVLIGSAHELSSSFPFGPLVDALRANVRLLKRDRLGPVAGALHGLLPEASAALPPPLGSLGDPSAERHRLFRAFLDALTALGSGVVVLEDLQWADGATLEFLRFARKQLPAGMTLIVTLRAEDADPALRALPDRGRHITLRPLDADEVRALVGGLLGTDELSEEFASYLHRRTGGVPFAVEEVVRLLEDRRDLIRSGGRWARRELEELEVPAAVRDSVLERVERLGFDARRLAQAAAVLGVPSPSDLVARVAGIAERRRTSGLLEALAAGILIEEEGLLSFRHVLARDAVYDAIAGPLRREMHLRAASALTNAAPARLAHHYRGADDPRWIGWAEEAADAGIAAGADEVAYSLLRDAYLALPMDDDRLAGLAIKLARAGLNAGEFAEATELVHRALSNPGIGGALRAELSVAYVLLLEDGGRASEAMAEAAGLFPSIEGRPDLRLEICTCLAWPFVREGTLEVHLTWLEQGRAAARELDGPLPLMQAQTDRAMILTYVADPEGSDLLHKLPCVADDMDQARELVRRGLNLGQAGAWIGDLGAAEMWVDRGREAADHWGYRRFDEMLLGTQVLIDFFAGRWQGLEERAGLLADGSFVLSLSADLALVLGGLKLARGGRDAAGHLEEALRMAIDAGQIPVQGAAAALLGRREIGRGHSDAGLDLVMPVVELVKTKGIWVWGADVVPVAVEGLLARGDPDAAERLVRSFSAGLRGRAAPFAQAMLWFSRGLVSAAGDGRSVRGLTKAAAALDPIPRAHAAAWAREATARNSAGEDAVALFTSALRGYRTLGASADAARVTASLRSLGVRAPNRRGRRGYGNELSPREGEVASLAAEGRSNREIAAAMFLSVKTVESHLASAMRKLGVRSRGELTGE